MAFKYGKNKEHAFVTITKDIREGNMPNIILLCGEEQYLVAWAAETLAAKYVSESAKVLDLSIADGESTSFRDVENMCETLPVVSERKVVILRDYKPEDAKEAGKYFSGIPETTMLIFTESGKPDRRITRLARENGRVYDFDPLDVRDLRAFINKRIHSAGMTALPSAVEMMISRSGYCSKDADYSLYNLENDIKKAIAHSTGSEVTEEDVSASLSDSLETNIFAMLDALSRNRKSEAFRLLHDLIMSGENHYRLLKTMASQVELMLCVREMSDEGMNRSEMHEELGIHEFRIKKAAEAAASYSRNDLAGILKNIYSTDERIKSGTLEPSMALEMIIAEI